MSLRRTFGRVYVSGFSHLINGVIFATVFGIHLMYLAMHNDESRLMIPKFVIYTAGACVECSCDGSHRFLHQGGPSAQLCLAQKRRIVPGCRLIVSSSFSDETLAAGLRSASVIRVDRGTWSAFRFRRVIDPPDPCLNRCAPRSFGP